MLNRVEAHFTKENEKELIIVCRYLDLADKKEYYKKQGYTYKYKKILNY